MLRFGDQLLTLGRTALAGMTSDAVHCRLRCGPVNNIVMAVSCFGHFFLTILGLAHESHCYVNDAIPLK